MTSTSQEYKLKFQVPFFCKSLLPGGPRITYIVQLYFIELTCPLYEPPENGALACNTFAEDKYCQVQCQSGYDFVFNPPLSYFCLNGEWDVHALPGQEYSEDLPWPDCAGKLGVGFGN